MKKCELLKGQNAEGEGKQETRITRGGNQESRESGFVAISQIEKTKPICRPLAGNSKH